MKGEKGNMLQFCCECNIRIENIENIKEYFRECKKFLNHYAAVTTLEFLDSDEIRNLAFNYMMKLREKKQNGSGGTGLKSKKKKK